VDERYSRQDGQLNEDRLTKNSVSLNDVSLVRVGGAYFYRGREEREEKERGGEIRGNV